LSAQHKTILQNSAEKSFFRPRGKQFVSKLEGDYPQIAVHVQFCKKSKEKTIAGPPTRHYFIYEKIYPATDPQYPPSLTLFGGCVHLVIVVIYNPSMLIDSIDILKNEDRLCRIHAVKQMFHSMGLQRIASSLKAGLTISGSKIWGAWILALKVIGMGRR